MKTINLILFILTFASCNNQNQDTKVPDKKNVDTLSNLYTEYYDNGKLKIEVEIINGLQNGTLKEFYDNGQLKCSQDWKMGEPLGDYKLFDQNGNLLFHEKLEYKKYDEGVFKVYTEIFNDTTKNFKITDRVVVKDLGEFKKAIKVIPNKIIKYGVDNEVGFSLPNVTFNSCSIENGTVVKKGDGIVYVIKPKSIEKNVIVKLTAKLNDTIINFVPIELTVNK